MFPVKYLLNIVFVPLYGIMGAAVSSLISLAIAAALLIIRLKKLLNAPILALRFLGIVCTAAVLMMCV
ncbi:polysaccharide biosynthesis C-terminal domain-containing protein, partial [Alkalihalophilus pseudofirmus]